MAGVVRNWTKTLAVAALLTGAVMVCLAQSARTQSFEGGAEQANLPGSLSGSPLTGSLTGKLTGLHSNPLGGVPVVARNQATGAETRTITTKNGSYRFTGLEPGEYALESESPQLGRGHLEGIAVAAGYEAHVQAAIAPLPREAILAALCKRSLPGPEPEALPVTEAALAAEPLWTLPLSGRSLESPAPSTVEASARVGANDSQVPESGPLGKLKAGSATQTAEKLVQAVSKGRIVSGHDFSRAVNAAKSTRALAPAGCISPSLPDNRSFSAARASATSATVQALPLPTAPATAAPQTAVQLAPTSSVPERKASQESSPATLASTTKMSAAELQALPVSGRRWQDFVLDNTPASTTPAAGQGQISLRGASEPANVAVDGAGRGLAFGSTGGSGQSSSGRGPLGQNGNGPAGMAQAWAGGHGLAVSEAAIRTVETEAGNVEAAADRASGGRMNVETQSGANELHGQGFLFDRQSAWGAQNPFSQWVKETSPATGTAVPVFTPESYTPPDRETTWGIGMGSRIRRNKLFWFAALDSYNRNDPGLATVKIPSVFFAQPTNDQMQVLSARLGLSSANPVAEGLAGYSALLETLGGLLGPAPRTATQWTGFGRLDWQAAERHRLTLEGTGARWNAPGGGLTRVSETYGNRSFGSSTACEEWLLGRWEAFVTPNLLAVTQVSAGRAIQEARPETPLAYEQTFLAGNAWGQLPQIIVDSSYGFTIGNPSRFGQGSYPDEHLYHAQESVDWVRGKLLVRAGFEMSHNTDATSLLRNQTGTYYYSSVENFASDALVFGKFGLTGALNPYNQQNCDATGKAWRDSAGNLRGLGNLPCYSYYSQTIGPSNWRLSTNDWAGFATAQWQVSKLLVVSGGLRWEREQLPPPLTALQNADLPLTGKLPSLGNQWGPRVSVAVGNGKTLWPVLRLGYGMYFGRTENLTVETALTQTGSLNGDLNFFMRPTDNLNSGGAPPFPYVLRPPGPGSVVEPGAAEFAPGFRNPEIHQGIAAVEETLPGHVEVTASAMVSLGRRLPISIDTNLDLPTTTQTITYNVCDQTPTGLNNGVCGNTGQGPIKAAQITVPFYASGPTETGVAGRINPNYQQITQMMSRANSTYEAAMLRVERYGWRGMSLHAHYTYAHAMDWNPNESAQAAGNDVLDPADFSQEYGTSNLDMRHSAGAMAIYKAPWKLRGRAGKLGNGWMLSGVGQYRSGLPYTMRTSGSLPEEFDATTGAAIAGLGPGMNGSGGDNRVYGFGSDGHSYNIGRNTYRYPATWKADLRLGRRFDLRNMRQLELLAESFNLFNHQNVTELETTGYTIESGSPPTTLGTPGTQPRLNFLTGLKVNAKTGLSSAFGQPLNINATNFYRERQIQFGLRLRF